MDKSFDDAIGVLREKSGVNIVVDPKIEAAGIPHLNLHVTEMSQDLALDWILRLAGLEKSLRDGAVYLTVPQQDFRDVQVVAYNIKNLTEGADPAGTAASIVDLMIQNVQPDQWDPALGTSVEELDGWLLVCQSSELHKKVKLYLEKLLHQRLSKMH